MARRDPPPEDGRKPKRFEADRLDRTTIAFPLLDWLRDEPGSKREGERRGLPGTWRPRRGKAAGAWLYPVVIDLHLGHPPAADGKASGRETAKRKVETLVVHVGGTVARDKTDLCEQYVFTTLSGAQIQELVRIDHDPPVEAAAEAKTGHPAIYRVWPDFAIEAHIDTSVRTIKCDAARVAFSARGEGIVWAVMDSGVDGEHPHFRLHDNLGREKKKKGSKDPSPDVFDHQDYTVDGEGAPLTDELGHGSHVAGIVAGEIGPPPQDGSAPEPVYSVRRERDTRGEVVYRRAEVKQIAGMAPCCRIVSLKVLDAKGRGSVSNLLAAIAYVQKVNGDGRRLQIHGVNMSVGYGFDPEWFACGQSPLCVEVDRLVRCGVVVVVAAGNTGYGFTQVKGMGVVSAGLDLTINDPGNAELAITVGATHRDSPHVYGVSYFSSKGPTGDGRLKPDLLAPGEKILSCAAGKKRSEAEEKLGQKAASTAPAEGGEAPPAEVCHYVEDSGTSMAAPHVSGAVAAFLSVRREFIGQPERVKEIFLSTATDLERERYFQGQGLVDLMRAIQSI
jgi:subtilisin family serine protease